MPTPFNLPSNLRIGTGFDCHRYSEDLTVGATKTTPPQAVPPFRTKGNKKGEFMTLGLVTIEEFPKFEADSDGDIIVHSIANAILNGLGAGDLGAFIGMGIATTGQEIVAKLNKLLQDKGASIVNISVNFIGNKPNISKYRNEMEIELSEALGNAPVPSLRANGVATSGCVTISAATTDGLGFTGQGEGAYCTSTVLLSFQG